MKSVIEVIDDLQARALSNEILFQSIIHALPDDVKASVLSVIEQNFAAFDSGTVDYETKSKLAAAKIYASRVSGAKL
ncbi:hypothetical protein ACOZZ4_004348 [Cronobacter dublinensis]|uniref:hypothetical protein n=1 Tax=Cronobacter TaxID=413496 RepID=UPI0023D99C17|nr:MULTISPECIES: hypothetical protein [Cronobacter]ELY2669075.1 hypothetical protein [Cronobacter sakazakii]ELY2757935.1 hypothetical protein [Cronobacter sakazakii]ELY3999369.1 hypothetical protein [Cronobacter sakazakii]ELY4070279.1 hypothetical protein [Cronobacter sakazakii]ELY4847773.1 hypothetical protein [Cronobacter sakazakii]